MEFFNGVITSNKTNKLHKIICNLFVLFLGFFNLIKKKIIKKAFFD
jgi:hypothetical protein